MGHLGPRVMPLRKLHFDQHRARAFFYLFLVPIVIVGILVAGYLNHRTENKRAVRQAEVNRKQIVILRHALSEACHATTVLYGITTAITLYVESQPKGTTDPIAKLTTDTLAGYANDLNTLTACQNIARP